MNSQKWLGNDKNKIILNHFVLFDLFCDLHSFKLSIFNCKQGLIATRLSVLEALVFKIDANIHPWYYKAEDIHPWLLQHMCTVDSVQCSVGLLQEPDGPEQIQK